MYSLQEFVPEKGKDLQSKKGEWVEFGTAIDPKRARQIIDLLKLRCLIVDGRTVDPITGKVL
jgi:hypothetical protein